MNPLALQWFKNPKNTVYLIQNHAHTVPFLMNFILLVPFWHMPFDHLTDKIFFTCYKLFCGVEGGQQWPWAVIHSAVAETIDGFVMDEPRIALGK
jgi:hypothetical protein